MSYEDLEGEGQRVLNRHNSKEELRTKSKNTYYKQTETFYKSQITYAFPDGSDHPIELLKGLSFTYFVTGYWSTYKNVYGDWYVLISALAKTEAEALGETNYNGNATLLRDGFEFETKPLMINGPSLYNDDIWTEVGETMFKLPFSGSVDLKLYVDFNVVIPGCGSASPITKLKEKIHIYP